ncbi:MAG: cation transporter [Candidatus Cloacimonas sp. 4484_275]|nr:MAG: cation transporter [Candidatus Cloacimonas sp. 4484_275]RLC51777.1 MAG: cation transporter [Candidatus Cloacimonadota bacterium]
MDEHRHHHGFDDSTISEKKLFYVTALNVVITIAEIIGGLISGSLALLSDSIHNLSDTISIMLSYFALKIAQRPRNEHKTFGYKRAEIIAAFINASVLLVISLFLIIEAYKRFRHPEEIKSEIMIIVASIGLIANFVSVFLLEKDSHKSLNLKSSYLHLFSDTVSSVGVVLGGIAIKIWNIFWIDPLITLLISLYIIGETWKIIKKTVDILMQSAAALDYENLKTDIEKINNVKNIHHVHTWLSNDKTIYFEAHLELEDMMLSETQKIYKKIEKILKEKYNISHLTIQFEVDVGCDKNMFENKKEKRRK